MYIGKQPDVSKIEISNETLEEEVARLTEEKDALYVPDEFYETEEQIREHDRIIKKIKKYLDKKRTLTKAANDPTFFCQHMDQ